MMVEPEIPRWHAVQYQLSRVVLRVKLIVIPYGALGLWACTGGLKPRFDRDTTIGVLEVQMGQKQG